MTPNNDLEYNLVKAILQGASAMQSSNGCTINKMAI